MKDIENVDYEETGETNSSSLSEETAKKLLMGRSFYRKYSVNSLIFARWRKFILVVSSLINRE